MSFESFSLNIFFPPLSRIMHKSIKVSYVFASLHSRQKKFYVLHFFAKVRDKNFKWNFLLIYSEFWHFKKYVCLDFPWGKVCFPCAFRNLTSSLCKFLCIFMYVCLLNCLCILNKMLFLFLCWDFKSFEPNKTVNRTMGCSIPLQTLYLFIKHAVKWDSKGLKF